jgi:hypothetical protein
MKQKVDSRFLIAIALGIILCYCGFRTLSTLRDGSGHSSQSSASAQESELEYLLQDLQANIVMAVDSSHTCENVRNPLAAQERPKEQKSSPKGPGGPSSSTARRSSARLTGLVLDKNPVAIVEVDDHSIEVKVGDLLDGYKIIAIDELGVHILRDGEIVIIR